MAIMIHTDETFVDVLPSNGSTFRLHELYGLIDCDLIELVPVLGGENYLIIDEEGKLRDKEVNVLATMMYDNPNDVIVGKALLVRRDEIE